MVRIFTVLALGAFLFSAQPAAAEATELFSAKTVAAADVTPKISDDEDALKIENKWPTTVRLANFDVSDKKIDESVVTFTAEMQGVNFVGAAYLEMWLHFPGKGFFFGRGLDNQLTQDGGWKQYSASFILKKGEQPDNVVLNLRFDGAGTVRIRNLKAVSQPAPPQEPEKPAEKPKE